jgi:hypothetical protein
MFMEALGLFTGIFVVVNEGQHAVKFHLGRAKKSGRPRCSFQMARLPSL